MPDIPTELRIIATMSAQCIAACRHTPGGKLLPDDLTGLIRRTARMCGVTVEDVRAVMEGML